MTVNFSPNNAIVRLCLLGMQQEETGDPLQGGRLYQQAWQEAADDFEKYLAAYFIARNQPAPGERLRWYEASLERALRIGDEAVKSAYATLYTRIAETCQQLNDFERAERHFALAASYREHPPDKGPFYHGTRAHLQTGDLLTPGRNSNYKEGLQMNHIYFTAQVNGAGLAAALAKGDGEERVYLVEPEGSFENDPNVTDKKFPGNPTRSYRTAAALKITGTVMEWERLSPTEIQSWRERLKQSEGEIIN